MYKKKYVRKFWSCPWSLVVLKIPDLLEALLSSLFSLLFKLAALPRFPPQPMIFCLLEKREVSVALLLPLFLLKRLTSNNQ